MTEEKKPLTEAERDAILRRVDERSANFELASKQLQNLGGEVEMLKKDVAELKAAVFVGVHQNPAIKEPTLDPSVEAEPRPQLSPPPRAEMTTHESIKVIAEEAPKQTKALQGAARNVALFLGLVLAGMATQMLNTCANGGIQGAMPLGHRSAPAASTAPAPSPSPSTK